MSTKTTDAAEYLVKQVEETGVACATTSDGHVIILTKAHVEDLLKKINDSGRDKCVIFIKRQDFANAN